jgi:hypothetical protein
VFPAARGGYIDAEKLRYRHWTPAFRAADVGHRRVYDCRHTFASFSIAAGMSLFHLSRVMGCSVQVIDDHYGHLLPDSEEYLRGLLDITTRLLPQMVGLADAAGRDIEMNARFEVWFLSDDRISVFVETDQETGDIQLREVLEITTVAAIGAGVIANLPKDVAMPLCTQLEISPPRRRQRTSRPWWAT